MGVEFNEGNNFQRNFGAERTPKLAAWLISKGIAKDEAAANKVQITAAIIFFLLAGYFAFF
jgi:hypothetical protein